MSQETTHLVAVENGKVVTTSLKIAEVFGKRHDNVIRDIENVIKKVPDFGLANFEETQIEFKMPTGGIRKDKAYTITRDGFTILAMSFTGAKAMQFKLDYIAKYNAMERRLSMPTAADVMEKGSYTPKEIADRYKVSLATVKQWHKSKKLTSSLPVKDEMVRYALADLARFEELI